MKVIAVTLLSLWSLAASAGDKPDVQIRFRLAEPDYLTGFTNAEVGWIEQQVGHALVERLGPEFRFVDFGTATGPEHVLTVELRRAGSSQEVGYHANLEGPSALSDPIYSVFRPDTAAGDAVGTKQALARELKERLSSIDHDRIGKQLLGKVPIPAAGTQLLKRPWLGFKIPFTLSELCMDKDSLLLIENTIPVDEFMVEKAFEATSERVTVVGDTPTAALAGPIYTRVKPGQDLGDELKSADPDQVIIRMIYVIDYNAFDERENCEQLIRPVDVEFGGAP
jgi:hypothetical protein